MKISVRELLKELICISEKSAQISKICRLAQNEGLFKMMMIQEKLSVDSGKNPRFKHDYKTFADVLIQEMATFCLDAKFPGLSKQIYGEENNHFENKLGHNISININKTDSSDVFLNLLIQILDGNHDIAKQLVQIIYSKNICDDLLNEIGEFEHPLFVEQSDIAIWIDPIDSTSEYIKGIWPETSTTSVDNSLIPKGLHCVTCLFGVFDTKTALPILGVINQPFFKKLSDNSYEGRCIWGFKIDQISINNIPQESSSTGIILCGGKESTELKAKLNKIAKTMYIAGAGHKILNVAVGKADLLVTSSRSTYYWDTCAPHAILRSLGGGIIPFENYAQLQLDNIKNGHDLDNLQIKYRCKTPETKNIDCNNSKGLIAFRNLDILKNIINSLSSSC